MRSVINISLSKELSLKIDSMVKKGKFSTKSEFIRDLIRRHLEEEEILRSVNQSRKEIAQGKGKILRSLRDLR